MNKEQFDQFVKFCTSIGITTPLFGIQIYKSLAFNELKYFLTLNPKELKVIFVEKYDNIFLEHESGISYIHWLFPKKSDHKIQIIDKDIAKVFCNVENFLIQKDMSAESYLNRTIADKNKIAEFNKLINFINQNDLLTELKL